MSFLLPKSKSLFRFIKLFYSFIILTFVLFFTNTESVSAQSGCTWYDANPPFAASCNDDCVPPNVPNPDPDCGRYSSPYPENPAGCRAVTTAYTCVAPTPTPGPATCIWDSLRLLCYDNCSPPYESSTINSSQRCDDLTFPECINPSFNEYTCELWTGDWRCSMPPPFIGDCIPCTTEPDCVYSTYNTCMTQTSCGLPPVPTNTPGPPPVPPGAFDWTRLYRDVYPDSGTFFRIESSLTFGTILTALNQYVFPLAGLLLLIYLLYGGFQYLTSGGDPQKTNSAKRIITHALIGFIIVFLAFWIVQIVARILGTTDVDVGGGNGGPHPVSVAPDFPGVCFTHCFNNGMTCVDECTTGAPGFTYVLTCSNGITRHVNDSNFPGGNACGSANINNVCASQGYTNNSFCCCE